MAWGGGDGSPCYAHDCPPAPWVPLRPHTPPWNLTIFDNRLMNAGFPEFYYTPWAPDYYPMAEVAIAGWAGDPEGAVSCHGTYPYTQPAPPYCWMNSSSGHREILLDRLPTNVPPFHYKRIGVGWASHPDPNWGGFLVAHLSEYP
jgi:hypothetical protein